MVSTLPECGTENGVAVLEKAEMNRKNILTLRFFTTDMDAFLENYDVYAERIAEAGIRPPPA